MTRILLVLLIAGAPAIVGGRYMAQSTQPPAHEGFVPVDQLPNQEQLPAAPLVAAAYAIAWAVVLVYVWFLWRRLRQVERELETVARRISRAAPGASGAEWATGPAERSEPGGVQGPPPLKQ